MSKTKKYYWLKLKNDFFNQREVKKLRRVAGGDTYTIIYLKMQLLSIKNDGIITFERTEEHLDEQLSLELDEDLENVRMTLSFLHSNGLIEPISEDDFLLNKVPELIGSESNSAERVRAHRERLKEQKALQCNAQVTKSNTEIELEKEKELEKDNKKSVGEKRKRFTPPTPDQVKSYCSERGNNVDANRFVDYYTSKGWMIGKNKMKDWKAAVRTWERTSKQTGGDNNVRTYTDWEREDFEKSKKMHKQWEAELEELDCDF